MISNIPYIVPTDFQLQTTFDYVLFFSENAKHLFLGYRYFSEKAGAIK
jgi:hypothetical protein